MPCERRWCGDYACNYSRSCCMNHISIVEPSFVFAFVETFINILEEYLGGFSSTLIKDHFDIVYQVSIHFLRPVSFC